MVNRLYLDAKKPLICCRCGGQVIHSYEDINCLQCGAPHTIEGKLARYSAQQFDLPPQTIPLSKLTGISQVNKMTKCLVNLRPLTGIAQCQYTASASGKTGQRIRVSIIKSFQRCWEDIAPFYCQRVSKEFLCERQVLSCFEPPFSQRYSSHASPR